AGRAGGAAAHRGLADRPAGRCHLRPRSSTAPATSRRMLDAAPRALPIGASLRSRGLSPAHVTLSVGLMAVPVAAAAVQGLRTRGRSRWFRGALLAFGLHGSTHLAGSIGMRGARPGVATVPVVAPPLLVSRPPRPRPAGAGRHRPADRDVRARS